MTDFRKEARRLGHHMAYCKVDADATKGHSMPCKYMGEQIAFALQSARAKALEDAAKVAERHVREHDGPTVATAIRALIEKEKV